MSCNNKLRIVKNDTKNLQIVITRDDKITKGKLTEGLPVGIFTGNISIELNNTRDVVPGEGVLILLTQANEQQLIPYDSVTNIGNIYQFAVDTMISYQFYEGYEVNIDGGRVDLTNDTITFTAYGSDGVEVITKDATIIADTNFGECVIMLVSTDTNIAVGEYVYNIVWNTSAGVSTLVKDNILEIK